MAREQEASFESAIQYWRNVSLVSLQKDLDQQAIEIINRQKDGLVSRKKLAEHTREFKKKQEKEKLQQLKSLLKDYQTEIDNITKRTKFAENSFLSIFKILSDAPDPAPLFEVTVEKTEKLIDLEEAQSQNATLKKELEAAKESIKQLEADAKKRKQAEDVFQREEEIKKQYNDKIVSYKEREYELQRQLSEALDTLNQLRDTHDDTQAELISHNQKYDEKIAGKLAELDIVLIELERANATVADLKSRNEALHEELTLDKQKKEKRSSTLQEHDDEFERLRKDVESYKDVLHKTEARLSKKVSDLSSEAKTLTDERDKLKKQLQKFEDYDEIKRELRIMKYIEFSTGDDEDETFDAGEMLKKDGSVSDSLELQLMEKNKKIESELTQLKMERGDLKKELENKSESLQSLESKHQHQSNLVTRLEEDLVRLGQVSSLAESPSQPSFSADQSSPRSSDVSSMAAKGNGHLPIIIEQRNRFKQRITELEELNINLKEQIQVLLREMEGLKKDNVSLYQRLRFVHVWKEEQDRGVVNRSVAVSMDNRAAPSTSTDMHDDPTQKYGRIYEENMNPFVQFHQKEERRHLNALNPADKLTLKLTRLMFSRKWIRHMLVVYALLLHFLVVATLYQLSLWECRHDHEIFNMPMANDDPGKF